jgi:SAM-dependent methyltransferase
MSSTAANSGTVQALTSLAMAPKQRVNLPARSLLLQHVVLESFPPMPAPVPTGNSQPSVMPLPARMARAVRRALGIDRESKWNRAYASGDWDWLRNLDEMAHHAVLAGYAATLKPDRRVLDMGCGTSRFHAQLRGCYREYVGVDFAEPVRQAALLANERTHFEAGDMNDYVPTGIFDLIVFNESLYYLVDTLGGLQRYERYLAPDGVLLISMYGKESNDAIWNKVQSRYVVLDSVMMTNRSGVSWTTEALVPPGSTFTI